MDSGNPVSCLSPHPGLAARRELAVSVVPNRPPREPTSSSAHSRSTTVCGWRLLDRLEQNDALSLPLERSKAPLRNGLTNAPGFSGRRPFLNPVSRRLRPHRENFNRTRYHNELNRALVGRAHPPGSSLEHGPACSSAGPLVNSRREIASCFAAAVPAIGRKCRRPQRKSLTTAVTLRCRFADRVGSRGLSPKNLVERELDNRAAVR